MRHLTSAAFFLLSAGLVGAHAQEAPAGTYADRMIRGGPYANEDSITAWVFRQDAYPFGAAYYINPFSDPQGERRYLGAVTRDSMVWIQAPDSSMFAIDAHVAWELGLDAAEYVGYDTLLTNDVGYGWDVDKGVVYLTLTQAAPLKSILVGILTVFGVLLLGTMLLITNLRRSVARAVERGRRLADSRHRLADSREAERLRLARDLHDGPLQDLQAVRMRLGIAGLSARGDRAASGAEVPPLGEAMEGVQGDVLRVIDELREISEGLRPPVLSSFGLAAAVRDLVIRQRTVHPGVEIALDFEDPGNDLPDRIRLALYRIVQEASNNALSHGEPTRIDIAYSRTDEGGVDLSVTDDGTGFTVPDDLHDLEQEGHLGLAGMSERADSIRGRLDVTSASGETRIHVRVPPTALTPALV